MRFWKLLLGFASITAGIAVAGPVVPGLHGKHPLDAVGRGKVLLTELRCAACHTGLEGPMKQAPDLREAGSRLSGDYLRRFLSNPHATHAGTTMPDVLGGLSEEEKLKVSESISYYLGSLVSGQEPLSVKSEAKLGYEIYHEVGCVACHSPRDEKGKPLKSSGVVSLEHVGKKYHEGELARFLMDPLAVRPSGRMPNMKLTSGEASALEVFLGGGRKMVREPANEEQIAEGKANFEKFNCHSCHDLGAVHKPVGPSLREMTFEGGCLTGKGVDYQLEEEQVRDLRAALRESRQGTLVDQADRIAMTMTRLNCIACHVRDDFGGVAGDLDGFFHTTEEALGDAARIPPPLTKIGGKLRPEWLDKVLYEGMSVRPYMKARMPQYGRVALEGLPDLLEEIDQGPPIDLPPPGREDRPMVSNGGHLLLGSDGLNCISCHNYNGKDGPAMKGYDLILTYQRLQPGWFYEFMKDPAAHRPGIIMPNYWPGGKAVQTEILDGDTHEQLRALWYQFSLGRSARDPKGLVAEPNKLEVTERVRVYRGRSRVAGYRGIAVGYPGGLSYAFNAQNGVLSAIWSGEFVTANWRSQGAGDFNPIGRPVQLAEEVAFLQLKDESRPWPLKPVTTKEDPVISDPLYPGNYGYAFKGYALDETGNPTFRYHCGEVAISDRSEAEGDRNLRRRLVFDSPEKGVIYFRALAGQVTANPDGSYAIPGLKITLSGGKTILRESAREGERELLVRIPLVKGKSNYSINYEILL